VADQFALYRTASGFWAAALKNGDRWYPMTKRDERSLRLWHTEAAVREWLRNTADIYRRWYDEPLDWDVESFPVIDRNELCLVN